MPPGVRIGPPKGSNLVQCAQERSEAEKHDKERGAELQHKYERFVEAAKLFNEGDYVKVNRDDVELLQRELQEFAKIDDQAQYASDWEAKMSEMVGKAFRVNHACRHTGQLLIDALPGAQGSQISREHRWSQRYVNIGSGGGNWLLPATLFQKLTVLSRSPCGHELRETGLAWYQGYVHSRHCSLCKETISRSDHRYQCEESGFLVCSGCFTSPCKEDLQDNVLTRIFVYGTGSIRAYLQDVATFIETKFDETMNHGDITVNYGMDARDVKASLVYKRSPIFNFSDFNWEDASFQLEVTKFCDADIDWKSDFEQVHPGIFKIIWSGDKVDKLPLLGPMRY